MSFSSIVLNPLNSTGFGNLAEGVVKAIGSADLNNLPFSRGGTVIQSVAPNNKNPFERWSPEWNMWNAVSGNDYQLSDAVGTAPRPDITSEMVIESEPIVQIRERDVYRPVETKGTEKRRRNVRDGNPDLDYEDPRPMKKMRIPYNPSLISEYEM